MLIFFPPCLWYIIESSSFKGKQDRHPRSTWPGLQLARLVPEGYVGAVKGPAQGRFYASDGKGSGWGAQMRCFLFVCFSQSAHFILKGCGRNYAQADAMTNSCH